MAMTRAALQPRPWPWLASYPEDVAWDQPLQASTLGALFDRSARAHASKTCCVFSGRPTTYADLAAQVETAAAGLAHHGVVKGTRVGLLLPNTPTYLVYFFATLKLGAVVVNFNPLLARDELAHQVRDSGTTVMVTLDLALLFDKVEALIETGVLPRAVIASFPALLPAAKSVLFKLMRGRELANPSTSRVADRLLQDASFKALNESRPAVTVAPSDLAVLHYTSGTTGRPKGAMLTHANLAINAQQSAAWSSAILKAGQERVLAVLPFFHIFAMTGIVILGIAEGFEIVIQPRFHLDQTIKLIAKSQPTVMPGVPTLFNAIMSHKSVRALDLKSLKVCLSGGAPLPLEVRKSFEAATKATLVEAYGLSEASPAVTCNPLDGRAKAGSVGLPLPGTIVSVRDPDMPSRMMPLGQSGELCIEGPQVMSGYWQQPEATASAFVGTALRTGDIGYMDQDGFVFIVDRIKDVIVCAGFKVYPRHVEEAIYAHPAVEEATVIGVADEVHGESPMAFVKLKAGTSVSEQDLFDHLEGRLAKIEVPVEIEFRADLPKTMIGKLSKAALRAEVAAREKAPKD